MAARAPVTIWPVATSLDLPTVGEEAPEALGAPSAPAPAPTPTVLRGALRTAWFVGVAVFAVQFVLLVLHSWYLWDHFDLTADFGQYSQAWQQIATGHLNPYDTTYAWYYPHYGYPFYQADLELIMWPLSLLYWVYPHSVDLLIVQDAALAGVGLVAYRWALEHLQLHAPNRRFALVGRRRGLARAGAAAVDVLGGVLRLPLRTAGRLLRPAGRSRPVGGAPPAVGPGSA